MAFIVGLTRQNGFLASVATTTESYTHIHIHNKVIMPLFYTLQILTPVYRVQYTFHTLLNHNLHFFDKSQNTEGVDVLIFQLSFCICQLHKYSVLDARPSYRLSSVYVTEATNLPADSIRHDPNFRGQS